MNEIWKDIPGYDGYQVSNIGRVKSMPRNANRSGNVYRIKGERLLRPFKTKNGYLNIDLGNKKRFQIHRLVKLVFSGASNLCVDHVNGIKDDNRIENLEYVTHSENNHRAYKKGLMISGEKRSDSKLKAKDVIHIRDEYEKFKEDKHIIKKLSTGYGICSSVIRRILNRKTWKHV